MYYHASQSSRGRGAFFGGLRHADAVSAHGAVWHRGVLHASSAAAGHLAAGTLAAGKDLDVSQVRYALRDSAELVHRDLEQAKFSEH